MKPAKTDKPAAALSEHRIPANRQRGRILTGDALALLKTLPAASFDGCFCDPPYGLSFMGKAWDHGVPGSDVWAEVLRVLKPGAPLLAFGGTRTFHRLASAIEDAGFLLSDTLCWLHGQGFPKGHAQLKPAWEPVTLAWKKGTRVLNIDGARIPLDAGANLSAKQRTNNISAKGGSYVGSTARAACDIETYKADGRWPANVILDEEAAAALDQQSGTLKNGGQNATSRTGKQRGGVTWGGCEVGPPSNFAGDSGGASRFFYCAKASRKERNAGLEGMPKKFLATMGKGIGERGHRHSADDPRSYHQNTHPTVKPVKLCEYLAKLILPANPNAHLLVPFSGSGSEIVGARRAGWKRITGIELNPEYVAIAEKRMECQSSSACSAGTEKAA